MNINKSLARASSSLSRPSVSCSGARKTTHLFARWASVVWFGPDVERVRFIRDVLFRVLPDLPKSFGSSVLSFPAR